MTNKEKYLQRVVGNKSSAIIEAEWRVENRAIIKNYQKALLEYLVIKDDLEVKLNNQQGK